MLRTDLTDQPDPTDPTDPTGEPADRQTAKRRKGLAPLLRKRIKQWLTLRIGLPLGYALFRLFRLTWRHRRIERGGPFDVEPGWSKPCAVALFHGDLLLVSHEFCRLRPRLRGNVYLMASRSRDGEIIARLVRWVGGKTVRGSSSRGGGKALLEMVNALGPCDYAAIAVDGPRGPRHEVKDGILLLAKRTGLPVVPMAGGAARKWIAGSWDRLEIPRPFSRTTMLFGQPLHVPRDADAATIAGLREQLGRRLRALKEEADAGCRL